MGLPLAFWATAMQLPLTPWEITVPKIDDNGAAGQEDMRAFITGSRAYGVPRDDSDLDLVIFASPATLGIIRGLSDKVEMDLTDEPSNEGPEAGSFRFGKLNLICVTWKKAFQIWRDGTDYLKSVSPVTREQAVKEFTKRREVLDKILAPLRKV